MNNKLYLIFLAIYLLSCNTDPTSLNKKNNTPPTASFTASADSGDTATIFQFDASGSHDNEDSSSLLEVRWDWENDGTWDTDYSTTKVANHQFLSIGVKSIKLEVKDTGGLIDTATKQITVTLANTPPTASFIISPSRAVPREIFGVDASSSFDKEDNSSLLQVRWDWENDGTWDTGYRTHKTEAWSFLTLGIYTIKLEVKDTEGLTDTTTNQILITYSSGETGTVTDIDGNTYKTVKIGGQWWMAENLKVTHYRNGDVITSYYTYESEADIDIYGLLYNSHAVFDSRGLAPEGWRVPNIDELYALILFLDGYETAGGHMKETGFDHWDAPNTGATNESGFTALPSGYYDDYDKEVREKGRGAYFWTRETSYYSPNIYSLHHDRSSVELRFSIFTGYSVRCVKE